MTCQRERAMSPAACGAIVRSVPKGEEAISEEVDPERAGRKELSACACSRPCCRCPNAFSRVVHKVFTFLILPIMGLVDSDDDE